MMKFPAGSSTNGRGSGNCPRKVALDLQMGPGIAVDMRSPGACWFGMVRTRNEQATANQPPTRPSQWKWSEDVMVNQRKWKRVSAAAVVAAVAAGGAGADGNGCLGPGV